MLHFWGVVVSNKIYFGNIALLKNVILVTSSANKLKKILLLMTRIGALLSLIVAFVFLFKEGNLLTDDHSTSESAILIDRSPSVCSNKSNSDYLEVFQLENKTKSLKSEREQSGCLNKSKGLIQLSEEKKSSDITVFSDFQKSFLNEKIEFKSKNKKIKLVSLKSNQEEPNISIDSVWVESNFIKTTIPSIINMWVRNNGKIENKDVLVELRIGAKSVASKLETFLPNSRKKIQFSTIIASEKAELCEIRIDDASWTFDNNFAFVLKPTKDLPILVISENNSNPFKLAYDLELVFNCKTSTTLNTSAFEDNSLIIYNQSKNVSKASFEALVNHAKNGGTILIIPSEKWTSTETMALNSAIGRNVIENTAIPATEITIPDLQNPFFQNIFETKPSAGMMPTVHPIWKLNNTSEPILKVTNGDAALASIELGSGKLYITSFTMSETETFSRNSIFLPILYRIAEQSFKNTSNPYYRVSDDVVNFVPIVSLKNKEEVFSIENSDFKIIPDQRFVGNTVKLFLPDDDIPLGIWSVKNREGVSVFQFGLNNDKQESIVDFYSVDELTDKFKNNASIEVMNFEEFKSQRKLLTGKSDSWPNWWYAIVISFLFLLAEILVVRFYTHTAK